MDTGTLSGLDWPVILAHLKSCARTCRGQERAGQADFATTVEETRARYRAITEIWSLAEVGASLPLGGVMDIGPQAGRASRGEVLEPETLVDIGATQSSVWGTDRSMKWNG